jgi:hypothetical protein
MENSEHNEQQFTSHPSHRSSRKKLRWILVIPLLVLGVLLFGIVFFIRTHSNEPNPIPEQILKQTTYPLYYPSKAPASWHVDPASFNASDTVVIYTMQDGQAKFVISVQPLPSGFDFSAFKKKFGDTDEFNTDVGTVLIGDLGNELIASIRTNDSSWILINTKDYTAKAKLADFTRYFTKVK